MDGEDRTMDIAFFLLGVICLHYNKPALTFTIFMGLSTSYFQMGTNSSDFIISHNVHDSGMLLFFYMYFYGIWNKQRYPLPVSRQLYWALFMFGLFLILAILYDYARGRTIVSILQSYRHWLLLFFAMPLMRLYPISIFEKSVKQIMYISVFATVLILIDHYAGTRILHEDTGVFLSKRGIAYKRGAIPTTYCIFYIFLLLADYYKGLSPKLKYLFVGLLFLSIVASMIRSQLFSVLLGIFFVLYITRKIRLGNLGTILIGTVLMAGVVLSDSGLRERVLLGWKEVHSLSSSSPKKEKGNMSFRLDLLKERCDYVTVRCDRALLGIGSIREKEFPTTFKVGLYNARMGRPTQLDTSDIAWALLVLRLGILGTLILMVIWIKMISLSSRCSASFGKAVYVYLYISFLVSFCGPNFSQGSYWLFMVVLLMISYRQEYDKERVAE